MNTLIRDLGEFIITPLFRWILIFLSIIITILQYYNEPQRYSYAKAFDGLSYKWHLYIIAVFICITTTLTILGFWASIPFTDKLPEYWYIGLLILYLAIITQITVDSEQIVDDGTFNPPPTFMLPQKYRVMLTYAGLVVFILVMVQMYIYYGIADTTKKTLLSRYILERFGGWYVGNKIDFLFEWSGIIDVILKIYVLYLQANFQACRYGLPPSWNA